MKKSIFLVLGLLAASASFAVDKKITDLNSLPAASFATGDVMAIVDISANETKKTSIADFDARYGLTFSAPLSNTLNTISCAVASGAQAGCLSSADWSTFNGKQAALGFTPEDVANKDTDGTLAANSDTKYASQKAVKTYVDTGLGTKQNSLGFTPEDSANKDIDGTLAANSDTKYPSQKAVKTYADTKQVAGNYITGLTSDVTASGPGSASATVNSVGGSSAANVHAAELLANAATDANTASAIVKRDASGGFSAGIVKLLSDTFQFGTVDPFSRTQIWNKGTNASLRLGALAQDGDPADVHSEGSVFYGPNSQGTAINSATGDFGYARVKADRFGLYSSIANVANYYFRVDPTSLYLRNDSGTKTFEVTRATGAIDTALGAGVVHSDASGVLSSSAVSLTADVANTLPLANGGTNKSSYTAGSIPFATASALDEDNAKLFWNNTTKKLGIGTNTPTGTLDIFAEEGTTGVPHITLSGNVNEAGTIARNIAGNGGWISIWGGSTSNGGGAAYFNGNGVADGGSVQMTLGQNTANYDWFDSSVSVLLMRMQNDGNLGIGTSYGGTVTHKLEVVGDVYASGGFQVATSAAQPTCNSAARGLIWIVRGGAGVADSYQVCDKNSSDTYQWDTFSAGSGISSLNGLTGPTQTFATGTTGTDFGISSSGTTHTFNLPDAGATARGLITTAAQTLAGIKSFTSNLILAGSHLKSTGTAPVATVDANAGSGASCSVSNATDNAGKITIATTGVSSAAGAQCSLAFNTAFGVAPICNLTPANVAASLAHGVYVSASTTALSFNFANNDQVGDTYIWNYSCQETQ